jgi:hypothetical protein
VSTLISAFGIFSSAGALSLDATDEDRIATGCCATDTDEIRESMVTFLL